MKAVFQQMLGGEALKDDQGSILGWVLSTTNGRFTIERPGKRTKTKRQVFETRDDARSELVKKVGLTPQDVESEASPE